MSRKFALVIGNTEYADPGLMQLTAPSKDAADFGRVLKDQSLCAFDEVNILLNQLSSTITEAIDEFFDQKKPDDLLVLYFSGHGVRDEYGSLYLAFKNTIRTRLRATAVKSDYIRDAMDQSRSKRQVLILDCCNSGAFPQGTKAAIGGPMGMTTAFQGYGRFVLMASDATQFAWEGDKVIGETQDSLFTHFLVKGLEGDADRDTDGTITVDELYDYAFEEISQLTAKQTPTKSVSRMEGDIVLRHIARLEDIKPVALPSDLRDEVEDTRPYVREAAVLKLEKILRGRNLGMVRSALEALQGIASDENSTRRIAQAATQVLEAYRKTEQAQMSPETPGTEEHPPTGVEPQEIQEPAAQPIIVPAERSTKPKVEPVASDEGLTVEPPQAPPQTGDETRLNPEPVADIGQAKMESPAKPLPRSGKKKSRMWMGAIVGIIAIGGLAFGLFTRFGVSSGAVPPFIPISAKTPFTPAPVSIAPTTAKPKSTAAIIIPPTRTPFSTPSRTATVTRTRTATPTTGPTMTPVPNSPTFNFDLNANCRAGPGTAYEEVTGFVQGQSVPITGQNDGEARWWLVSIPGYPAWQCWVSDVTGSTSGPMDNVPIVATP